jgi:uncharacterized membrane protein YhaH (DUF805 family)
LEPKQILQLRGQSVGFTEAIRNGFQNYVTFSGRARRAEYWWWYLFVFLLLCVALIVDVYAFPSSSEILRVYTLASLALALPNISVTVRRLHDIGRSGWWFWLGLIPLIGALILLYWMIKRGDQGSNQFGPDPIAEEMVMGQ